MASTRNNNTPGNYYLEQKNNHNSPTRFMFSPIPV